LKILSCFLCDVVLGQRRAQVIVVERIEAKTLDATIIPLSVIIIANTAGIS
jgi:hypothetical protein